MFDADDILFLYLSQHFFLKEANHTTGYNERIEYRKSGFKDTVTHLKMLLKKLLQPRYSNNWPNTIDENGLSKYIYYLA
jgi:hypothetical protein